MLWTLPEQGKLHWKDLVATLVHEYNCTRSPATGISPYFLTFGGHSRLVLIVALEVKFADMESANTEGHTKSFVKPIPKKLRDTIEDITRT